MKMLKQIDKRWGSDPYTITNDPRQTIGSSACGPVSAASILATLQDMSGIVEPDEDFIEDACHFAITKGYRTINNGTSYGFFDAYFKENGRSIKQIWKGKNESEIRGYLADGHYIISVMGPGLWTSSGHYIVAYGINPATGMVLFNDPNSYREDRNEAKFQQWFDEAKCFFIVMTDAMPRSEKSWLFQKTFDLSLATMYHMDSYKYADALYEKLLAQAYSGQVNLAWSTIKFITMYKYGNEVMDRIYLGKRD